MFGISAARAQSPKRPTRLLSTAVALVAAAVAIAGCGSSGSQSTTKHASHKMPMTHTSTSMAMSHKGGHTAGSMAAMMAQHAEVTVASSPHYGNVLYDKDHFVLYVFSADHGATSTCYGACASAHGGWPPLLTKGTPRVAGLKPSLLGTTRRRDGSLQVTYAGHPLYSWSGDTSKTILCQHVNLHGGFWYVVKSNGMPNTAKGVGTMAAMSG
jgi:predicted lipoprotein with Yx(FWY)xxD motif